MPDSDYSPPTTISGSAMVVGLFALALAMALFAWFYARGGDRRALEAWGPERAALIDAAPTAELWVLSADKAEVNDAEVTDAEVNDSLEVDGQLMTIVKRYDITAARGVLHIRRGLIDDTSFSWHTTDSDDEDSVDEDGDDEEGDDEEGGNEEDDCRPEWTHVFSFADGDRRVLLLLSLDCPRVRLVETGQELSFQPIAAVVREFVAEQGSAGTSGE